MNDEKNIVKKNVGPIRHNEPPHANSPGVATVLSNAACTSMSTTTTTTTTTCDRGDCYGPIELAQLSKALTDYMTQEATRTRGLRCLILSSCIQRFIRMDPVKL